MSDRLRPANVLDTVYFPSSDSAQCLKRDDSLWEMTSDLEKAAFRKDWLKRKFKAFKFHRCVQVQKLPQRERKAREQE